MLLKSGGRGCVNEFEEDGNVTYYLYTDHWYRTISPRYWSGTNAGIICIGNKGAVASTWVFTTDGGKVQQSDGGVRVLRVMLFNIDIRGWSSNGNDEESGENIKYYLYCGRWYRTISGESCGTNKVCNIFNLYNVGQLISTHVNHDEGGVQF